VATISRQDRLLRSRPNRPMVAVRTPPNSPFPTATRWRWAATSMDRSWR